jgi:amino acid adenylation domain-containing protein
MDISDQDVYVFPASFAQRRMWFLDQFQPGSPFYNIPMAVRIKGALRVAALEQGIQEIVRRHESLRTTFAVMDGEPVQVIHKDGPAMNIALDRVDLRRLSAPEREAEIHRRAMAEAQLPFNLAEGPLLRAKLLKLGERDHALLMTMHHIVSDAWSQGVFIREMAVLYDAFSNEKPSPLPDLPLQYADFTEWQREWLQGEVMEAQLDYWRGRLCDNPPPLSLITDYPRPPVQTARGAKLSRSLPKPLANALKELCRREGATLFMTLLAAFQVLLHRYTGQDDISVGTPVANRNRAEIEDLIGCFINTLVMRIDISGDPSFRELLRRAREVALGAYAHQDLPFEKLVEVLKPERDMSRPSLFQVMLILQNVPREIDVAGRGLTLSALKIDKGTSNFDLTLTMVEEAKGLNATAEYNTDLFKAETIERLLQHLQTLLEGAVANPDQRVSTLPILTKAEEQQQLREWNRTQAEYSTEVCVHRLFEEQAASGPDRTAVVFEQERLTYEQLDRRANQLANYLRKLGVGPEVFVGLCVERSIEMIVGILGILKAGGAYVPLDPSYPKERLVFILKDINAKVGITEERLASWFSGAAPNLVRLDSDWGEIEKEKTESPESSVGPDNLAYAIYTSGSTGNPKGVLVTHENLVHSTAARFSYYREPVESFLLLSSFAFDSSVAGIFWTLCQGGELVLPSEGLRMDLPQLTRLIRENRISHMLSLPSLYSLLLEQAKPQEIGSLRTVIVAGESCPRDLIDRHYRALPNTALFNEYGPTEGSVWSSVYMARPAEQLAQAQVPIGRPIPNMRVYLLNPKLEPTPVGAAEEIYIGGMGITRGYLNRPDLTAERFIPDPFGDVAGGRLYRTGDLARYLPDGNIDFLGRVDQQVKIRGYRIELGEIETALQQHPAIREAVVLAREDEPGNKRLVAYLVSVQESAPTMEELRSFLRQKLPEYMAPAAYVWLDSLPMTPNGKIDRRALPAPDKTRPELEAAFVAPRTPAEERLAAICAGALGLERVGIRDNFFDLGGHSLLAVQVVSRVRQAFAIELPLRSLFENPTVAGLAENIETILWAAQSSQSLHDSAADGREEGEI